MAIITDKKVNVLHVPGEQFGVPPKNLDKETDESLEIVDLTENLPEKVVGIPSRSSVKIQVERKMTIIDVTRMAREILGVDVRRYQAITNNIGIFFFAFELSFYRCIQTAKEFFPNIDKLSYPHRFGLPIFDR